MTTQQPALALKATQPPRYTISFGEGLNGPEVMVTGNCTVSPSGPKQVVPFSRFVTASNPETVSEVVAQIATSYQEVPDTHGVRELATAAVCFAVRHLTNACEDNNAAHLLRLIDYTDANVAACGLVPASRDKLLATVFGDKGTGFAPRGVSG